MPQNIDNSGLALLMLSSKKKKEEGKDVWKMLLRNPPNNKIQAWKQKCSYNFFLKFS